MNITMVLVIAGVLFVLALAVKPLRKTIGLINIIFGIFACLTGIGIIIGLPMIIFGGILMFI